MTRIHFKTLTIGLAGMILCLCGFSQDPTVKLTTAMVDFQKGDFALAMPNFDYAIQHRAEMKAANIPKAYYHRAKCRIGMFGQFMSKVQETQDTTGAHKYENTFKDAFADYKMAKETDDGKWGEKIKSDMNVLYTQLLNFGIQGLNGLYSQKTLTAEQKTEGAKGVVELMGMCSEIKSDEYMPHDISGQANLILPDSSAALTSFNTAIGLYEKATTKGADLPVAYMYWRSSILERYHKRNLDNSLAVITRGKKALENEWAKVVAKKADYTPEAFKKLDDQYNSAKGDLQRMELDNLLNFPDKLDETKAKFEEELAKNPKDYTLRVAYANMMEKLDQNVAIAQYEKAMEIDPSKEIAPFNLGALYNNLAKEKFDAANAEKDNTLSKGLQDEGNALLGKAKPCFEKAFAANPKSLSAVRALKQIAITLNDMPAYETYKAKERELLGQ